MNLIHYIYVYMYIMCLWYFDQIVLCSISLSLFSLFFLSLFSLSSFFRSFFLYFFLYFFLSFNLSLSLPPLSLQTGILMGTFAQASQDQQHNPLIFRKERSHGTAGRWAECGGCADVLRPNCRWQLQQARWSCSRKKWTTVPPKLEMICIHFILYISSIYIYIELQMIWCRAIIGHYQMTKKWHLEMSWFGRSKDDRRRETPNACGLGALQAAMHARSSKDRKNLWNHGAR